MQPGEIESYISKSHLVRTLFIFGAQRPATGDNDCAAAFACIYLLQCIKKEREVFVGRPASGSDDYGQLVGNVCMANAGCTCFDAFEQLRAQIRMHVCMRKLEKVGTRGVVYDFCRNGKGGAQEECHCF